MTRELNEATSDADNVEVIVDNTDTVTQVLPNSYIQYWFTNVSLSIIYASFGEDTNSGARGVPIGPCQDDGAGNPIPGTGGSIKEDKFVGTVYFYSTINAAMRITSFI